MGNNSWKTAFLSLVFILIIGGIGITAYLLGQGRLSLPFLSLPQTEEQSKAVANNTASPSLEPQTGTIEGSLSYPSEGIPENLKICAEDIETKKQYCTDKHLKSSTYQYGQGYQLQVPAGKYEVFAFLPENPETKAYYSEFVTCGLSINCPSHQPISVTVSVGELINNIDPQDWYAPQTNSQVDETELIKQAVYAKTGLNESQAQVTVNENIGSHAKGGIREYSAVGGAYWIAAKVGNEWIAVYDGQAQPSCELIAPYNFPTTMVPECLDSLGQVVTR